MRGIFIIILLGLALLNGVNGVNGAATASAAPQQRAVEDPVEFANLLVVNQQFQQAREFIQWVLADESLPRNKREDLQYLLGLALSGLTEYNEAAVVLRALLKNYPDDSNIRLVLGRVLFLSGNDSAAQRQFDLVLADERAAPRMRQQALSHLAAIRARNGWRFHSHFNVSENDNAYNAPEGSNRIIYIGGFPFQTNAEVEKTIGADFGISANHRRRIAAAWQWENGFSYGGSAQAGALDAATDAQISSGARYLFSSGSVGGALFGTHRWEHGHPVSNGYGLRADISRVLAARWRVSSAAQWLRSNSQINDNADASLYHWQLRNDIGLSAVMNGHAQLSFSDNRARAARESYFTSGAQIGMRRDFGWGITAGANFSIARTTYGAPTALIGVRHRFTHKTTTLSLLKRDWQLFGFAPELSLVFNNRDSNISIYSYDNRVLRLNWTQNF